MKLEDLNRLENLFNFTYPNSYKRMCLDGMLYCGEYGPNWHKTEYPKYREFPSLLLSGLDIELLYANEIEKEATYMQTEEQYIKEYQLIPFAQTGGGDLYCFLINRTDIDGEMEIVLAPHDESHATILAQNISDFIFRSLLEVVAYFDGDKESLQDIRNMLSTHLRYLKPNQQKIVLDVYSRSLQMYEWKSPNGEYVEQYLALIKREDLEDLLKKELGFNDLNTQFTYMQ